MDTENSDFLKNTVVSLEELQVQASLGKAELSDKLEEIKKDSLNKFNNLNFLITNLNFMFVDYVI
jgi:hypothetical protein